MLPEDIQAIASAAVSDSLAIAGDRSAIERLGQAVSDLDDALTAACQRAENLASDLAIAQGICKASRDAHHATRILYEATLAENVRMQGLIGMMQKERDDARGIQLALQSAVLEITGKTLEQLQAEWAAADRAEFDSLERKQIRADRLAIVARAYHSTDPVLDLTDPLAHMRDRTIVVDPECLDEPAIARAITPRISGESMADLVARSR